ncbi:MAG: S1C family serine protease [Burkholderiaceae bacterium]
MPAEAPDSSTASSRRTALRALMLALGGPGFTGLAAAQSAQGPARAREIAPRGSLGEDERRNVEVFRRVSPSVVHINTIRFQRELFSARVTEVPRGSGTGFIWDKQGHVVTNFTCSRGPMPPRSRLPINRSGMRSWWAGFRIAIWPCYASSCRPSA